VGSRRALVERHRAEITELVRAHQGRSVSLFGSPEYVEVEMDEFFKVSQQASFIFNDVGVVTGIRDSRGC